MKICLESSRNDLRKERRHVVSYLFISFLHISDSHCALAYSNTHTWFIVTPSISYMLYCFACVNVACHCQNRQMIYHGMLRIRRIYCDFQRCHFDIFPNGFDNLNWTFNSTFHHFVIFVGTLQSIYSRRKYRLKIDVATLC